MSTWTGLRARRRLRVRFAVQMVAPLLQTRATGFTKPSGAYYVPSSALFDQRGVSLRAVNAAVPVPPP
ncbi:hypothetical protein AB0N88_20685 [Streptomyces sp. NPDC093516]|uniref:hypothetical protein n=1 Tax=Streptomyces sp. NPDC093516 TaxID=3155304 RepID=UPI00342254A5